MSLTAWRLVKKEYQREAFSGDGARRYGGRWNSPGLRLIYTAEHASLAVLEILVHLQTHSLMDSYILYKVEFQARYVETFDPSALPKHWRSSPPTVAVQTLGDSWLQEKRSAVLCVPSAVLPLERNYLINPEHTDFKKLAIHSPVEPDIDPRLSGG